VGRDILIPLGQHPHFKKITGKYKSDPATVTFCDALTLAIMQRAVRDRRLVIYGEDVRDWGGAFAVTRDLDQLLPHHRLFNTPISEDTIVGSAVGAAMRGLRPLVEIMYFDFLGCAGEALINQLAKWQGMSAGEIRLPVGVRVSVGSKYGAQHSQDLFSMLYGVPGLYLAYPATPFDAKTMLAALLNQDNPFVISESQKDYNRTTKQILEKFGLRIEVPPLEETGCFIGDPQVVREGQDFTLLAFGPALYTAALAALELEKLGYSAEVINGKWLAPFNFAPVIRSVGKTGQLILVAEAPGRGSHISSLAGDFSRLAFDLLDAPVGTVGSMNTVTPGWSAQQNFFPSPSTILDEIHANRPLKNYQPQTDRRHSTLEDKRYHGI
jgi:2-oxoisovalerate dehydrogenase E1 component